MKLRLEVHHPLERITLDAAFDAGSGLTAMIGPSGAGKTSLLNVIAGFLRPLQGLVQIDDEVLTDTARRIFRPPHERRIGYVFQEPRLFPHLSVRHNLQFGAWFSRTPTPRVAFSDVVDLLDLGALLARRPARLSGGEKQRVALGRVLLASPRLLLLDEPLAAVDVARRQDVLPYLDRLRNDIGVPTIYVTHTWSEVESRAERVVLVEEGKTSDRAKDS